jgi:DNA mismatch endonuclease Vsr
MQNAKSLSRRIGELPSFSPFFILHFAFSIQAVGYRFRLHGKNLPGRPDIVLKKYKTVIFVHGCLWYRHKS